MVYIRQIKKYTFQGMEHIISKHTLQAWDQTHGIPDTIQG